MNINESITFLFTEVTNAFWIKLDKSMKEIGLHGGQIFVLISLWKRDAQSQIEIANNLKISAPTVNQMIVSLKKGGFVKSRRDTKDKRVVIISLTKKGNDIRPQLMEQWNELENTFFGCLSETEKLIILQIFGKIKTNIFDEN